MRSHGVKGGGWGVPKVWSCDPRWKEQVPQVRSAAPTCSRHREKKLFCERFARGSEAGCLIVPTVLVLLKYIHYVFNPTGWERRVKNLGFVSPGATEAELSGRFADDWMTIAATRIHASLNGAAVKQASLRGTGFSGIARMGVSCKLARGGVDWQPLFGQFFQRLRPAFLNSTGLT